ncbi:MAG: molybdopterin-guanine dinucleotide biosynthesis protein A [Azospirillaceae bacterium]
MPIRPIARAALLAAGLACLATVPASAQVDEQAATVNRPTEADGDDRHEGYYHPPVTSMEIYKARAPILEESDARRRIGFVVALTREQLDRPYPPPYALFAKGAESEKAIIVALEGGSLDTLYRMRAMLAQLTAIARSSPLFVEANVADWYTFLDLLHMLGFTQLTVSDGETWAHRYSIE